MDDAKSQTDSTRAWFVRWCRSGSSQPVEVVDLFEADERLVASLLGQPHWPLERAALVGRGWSTSDAFNEQLLFKNLETARFGVPEARHILRLRTQLDDASLAGILSTSARPDANVPIRVLEWLDAPPFAARFPEDDQELPPKNLLVAIGRAETYSALLKKRNALQVELDGINASTKGQRAKRAESWAKLLWAWASLKAQDSAAPSKKKAADAILAEFTGQPESVTEMLPEAYILEDWIDQVEKEFGRSIVGRSASES